jgi:hypothetical protein
MDRRGFLKAMLVAGMAPAICKAENLMKVSSLPRGYEESEGGIVIPEPSFGSPGDIFTISGDDRIYRVTRELDAGANEIAVLGPYGTHELSFCAEL